jgi:hypothetical protein
MSKIEAEITLNSSRFQAGINQVNNSIQRLGGIAIGGYTAIQAFQSGLQLAGVAAEKLKGAFDLGGKLSDLSAQTGLAASQVLVLRQAFANAGLGGDQFEGAVARMQKALGGVNEEGKSTEAALARLGLTVGDLGGLSAEEQLRILIGAFAGLNDTSTRTRTAMDLFGRSGAKMLALFSDATALAVAADQVGSLGSLMDENAGKFDRISDSIGTLMGLKMDQFWAGIATGASDSAEAMERLSKVDLVPVGKNVYDIGQALKALFARDVAGMWKAISGGDTQQPAEKPPLPDQRADFAKAAAEADAQEKADAKAKEDKKESERLSKERMKLREDATKDLSKWREDEEIAAAESPEKKRAILMARAGVGTTQSLDARIAELGKLVALGNASTTEAEVADLQRLTGIRSQVGGIDRESAKKATQTAQDEIDAKGKDAAKLLDPAQLPQMKVWADSARSVGLGGNAATNGQEIAKLQAERQREGNTLLREIRDALKRNSGLTAPEDTLVFN